MASLTSQRPKGKSSRFHHLPEQKAMNDLLETGHRGAWRPRPWKFTAHRRRQICRSEAYWSLKRPDGLFADGHYEADTHVQRATLRRFGAPDRRVRFIPDRLILETEAGEHLQTRDNPRSAFAGHSTETPWDQLHAAYFNGYALWISYSAILYSYRGFNSRDPNPGRKMVRRGSS